jgi:chromosome segregation ATPase
MTDELSGRVPDELMEQLHHATERFHACRQDLERSMSSSEYRHQERINAAEEQLRKAEREMEELDERIKKWLARADSDET